MVGRMTRRKGQGGRGKSLVGGGRLEGQGPAIALAAPGCLLAVVWALAMAAFGGHPMWRQEDLNLSEVAAVRDQAEVVRLVERGEDPNMTREVRKGLLFDHPSTLTPLEAAVESGDDNMIHVLLAGGASLDAEIWNRLRCNTDRSEILAALDAHAPTDADRRCNRTTP